MNDEDSESSLYQPVLVDDPEGCLDARVAFIAACRGLVGAEHHLEMTTHARGHALEHGGGEKRERTALSSSLLTVSFMMTGNVHRGCRWQVRAR